MHALTSGVLGGRLAIRRHLGTGGFGTVYEAIDTKFGGRVAVKVLARHQPLAIYRFKREFRGLADVVHPNLVRLYDLTAEDEALYFTMELVDGIDLLSYVTNTDIPPTSATLDLEMDSVPVSGARSRPRIVEEARLRTTFLQLARGVQALHDAGKLHCDIKPSNVLVAGDGRVVLLDFGLIADIDGQGEGPRAGWGTPGYIAPEQVDGAELTPAADWYSVGVMLREALTGVEQPWCAELLQLARELTSESPASRPSGAEVQRRFGGEEPAMSAPPRSRLFGRARELSVLREAWVAAAAGQGSIVRVLGPSGIGKSALVEAFLDELPAETLVLRGRCYEQESVPYKALDSMVDLLAVHLRRRTSEGALPMPPHAHLLGRLFPVLRDLVPRPVASEEVDVQEQRRRASVAFRALLFQLAQTRPLVCFLDDLQWGDVDSGRLLVEVLRGPEAPPLLLVMAQRSDDDDAPFTRALARAELAGEAHTISLSELSGDDGAALAAHLLSVVTNERVEPGTSTIGLAEVVRARVARLDDATRRLVESVVLAGRPIDESIAIRAADLDGSSSRNAAFFARHARLVTARSTDSAVLLESHARVRDALLESSAPDVLRRRHLRIAESLLEVGQPDPDQLFHHFRGAGDDRRACVYAELAADRADDALAFDRAASLRGVLVELTPAGDLRWDLHERHAASLANAGRAIEAADAYERAAETLERLPGEVPDRAERLHLHRRMAGELTLRSGRLALGAERMKRALDTVGIRLPPVSTQTTLRAAGRRLRVVMRGTSRFRTTTASSESSRRRLAALWSACSGLTQVSPVHGDALGTQYVLEALDSGDTSAVIRGLGLESVFEAVIGGPFFGRRSEQLQAAIDRLAETSAEPYDRAWARACHGGSSWFRGDWESSLRYCDEAMTLYADHCRGAAWEIALSNAYRLPSMAYLGQLKQLCEIVPRAYAAAEERGDLFSANTLRLGQQSLTRLVADRPERAIEEADEAIAPFPSDVYLGPHYHHLYAVTQARLYVGAAEEAWSLVERSWSKIEGARFLFAQTLRIEIRHLRARAAIACALADQRRAKQLLAIASKDAKIVARDSGPFAASTASLIRAGVAGAQNRRDEAIAHLESAVAGFERARMALHVEAARDRLGFLRGGAEGERLRETSAQWLAGQQVRRPDALVRMLVPGV